MNVLAHFIRADDPSDGFTVSALFAPDRDNTLPRSIFLQNTHALRWRNAISARFCCFMPVTAALLSHFLQCSP
jgi:hypothetical protein